MFGIGPLYSLVIAPRFSSRAKRTRLRKSIVLTNVVLAVLVGAVCLAIGWQEYLFIQLPMVMWAGTAGVWLFYVQHQYEDAYWERGDQWSYADAALEGASYLKLPKVLQFFTGNIGLHHVHHLSARIPNYNLQAAHDNIELFDDVPVLTMRDGFKAVRFKLWDERSGRMVGFAEARRQRRAAAAAKAKPVFESAA
jgi:omega-6 fatty acid desaturase (delta-12 desaturase)